MSGPGGCRKHTDAELERLRVLRLPAELALDLERAVERFRFHEARALVLANMIRDDPSIGTMVGNALIGDAQYIFHHANDLLAIAYKAHEARINADIAKAEMAEEAAKGDPKP